ncbi:MAG: hypothetical protein HZB23_02170 [Deltaproteobacteria bacterium]|nr:hypothetical protein [Deltaproteobacteria bacterium]
MGNDVILDDAAEALFRELGGTDSSKTGSGYQATGLSEVLNAHDRRLDPYRALLVTFAQLLAEFFSAWKTGDVRRVEEAREELHLVCEKLNKMPGHDGRILIRHQGRGIAGEGRASAEYDTVILFAGLTLDLFQVRAASRRIGVTASDFPGIFVSAMNSLASLGIINIYFRLDFSDPAYWDRVTASLTAIGAHLKLVAVTEASAARNVKRSTDPNFILDENGAPDPNLEALAIVNKQKKEAVAGLIPKIAAVLDKPGETGQIAECTDSYEAVFAFKKLREALVRPPVEINVVKWFICAHDSEMALAEEVRTARAASRLFGKSSPKTARVLDALYAPDFRYQNPFLIMDRMAMVSELLLYMENSELFADLCGHVLDIMELRLDMAADSVLSQVCLSDGRIETRIDDGDVSIPIHTALAGILSFFCNRVSVKAKVKAMIKDPVVFGPDDYKVIAEDFAITSVAAEELIGLLRGCFDPGGHFLRGAFEKRIPLFSEHKEKVFEFLWHFLKEHMHRQERIGFLNSLKVLIDSMQGPGLALYTLLTDFVHDPETITFSDRNALMLANVLLRKFNKELHQDIEMTPEEVLNVVTGLDRDAVEFAQDLIDKDRERFFLKFRHIHATLREALDDNPRITVPLRYLLTLEREVYMLFALVGGVTGQAVLRSGLSEYGDPEFGIYEMVHSAQEMPWLLQILNVIVRALGRVGDASDGVLLHEIRPRMTRLINMSQEQRHRDQVRRLMKWVDESGIKIKKRGG